VLSAAVAGDLVIAEREEVVHIYTRLRERCHPEVLSGHRRSVPCA
jgi:hypothetical protein